MYDVKGIILKQKNCRWHMTTIKSYTNISRFKIVLTTVHCSENYSTDQFILLLFECCIGTLNKNYVLGGELKCRHILLFLMEYNKEEYCLHR